MSSLMPSATAISVLLLVGHLLGTQAQLSGSGKTTRYWDCCKPSCAWNGKGPFSRPVATCAKDGVSVQSDINLQSACGGGPAYTCNNNQPWAVNANLAYGFAAAKIAGSNEQAWCCTCMELTFTSTSIAGKKMIVQVTNTGGDLNAAPNHFDLQIPGGGVGLYNGCSAQWGAPPNGWGALYGGVGSKAECSQLPSQLQAGCFFRFEWFQGADNPDMTFREVQCPAELLARSQCSRGPVPVPPVPPPTPGIQWQTGPDGVWALACDFPGQDLSSAQVQGAQCSGTCKATAGCTHFAWTDFNGGTCWMKSGNRFKQDAVGSNNPSIVCGINGGGISWNGDWASGCDFKGQDLSSATVPGNQCGPTCASTAGCTHYTWTNYNGGTCWMKNGPVTRADAFTTGDASMVCGVIPGTAKAKFNTEAVSFTPGADGVWAMQCDFPGQDLSSAQGLGDQCSGKCKQTASCTHYAWTDFNGGTCWMKSGARTQADAISVADPTAVCGINSGTPSSNINWNGNWAMGCDFNGQDLSSANVPGDQCSNKCAATSGCTHYTWTSYNGGTCWMKSGAATKADAIPASDPSAVCGVLGGPVPPTPGPTPLPSGRGIAVVNNCKMPIWVAVGTNSNSAPLGVGEVQLAPGANKVYNIGAGGWAGRMWPKFGCDANGLNCDFGQSSNPCSGGCHPPADTKVEFNFPPSGQVWYDISLVDGYSLPVKITPNANLGGSCVETMCNLQMSDCPSNENAGLGDLHVNRNGKAVACLSPCKKWNYPGPYGLGQSEQTPNGHAMCCPTPPVSSPQCRAGPVVNTQFVNLVRSKCPSAYSFAYDDMAGLHACNAQTGFTVTFCPV